MQKYSQLESYVFFWLDVKQVLRHHSEQRIIDIDVSIKFKKKTNEHGR